MAALGDLCAAEALRDHRLGKAGERRQDRLGQDVQPAGISGLRIRSFQSLCFDFHISNIIEICSGAQGNRTSQGAMARPPLSFRTR